MLALQHALWRGNRSSVHSWDFLRQNNYNMNSSLETHLTEKAVISGGLRNRLIVDKSSGKGLRELHLPAKHPETCPVSVCSCSTQAARGDAISAGLHKCTVLILLRPYSWIAPDAGMTLLTDMEAMLIQGGKTLTFHLVLPRPQLVALKAKKTSRKDLLSALFYCLRMVFVQTTKQIYRDLLQHVQSLPVLRSSVEER